MVHLSHEGVGRAWRSLSKCPGSLQDVGMISAACSPYLLHLLGIAEAMDVLAELTPEAIKRQTFATLHQMCLNRSQQQPLSLAIKNLHLTRTGRS